MCRNIKTLSNFEPPATDTGIKASALQFVRKLKHSKVNQLAFELAVENVEQATRELIDSLVTSAAPRIREQENAKAKLRSANRMPSA
ncbi:MAG: hypothetical protein ACI9KN_001271 [Gammaproteobacteria bacterium]|jgi:hypothetical protein